MTSVEMASRHLAQVVVVRQCSANERFVIHDSFQRGVVPSFLSGAFVLVFIVVKTGMDRLLRT